MHGTAVVASNALKNKEFYVYACLWTDGLRGFGS